MKFIDNITDTDGTAVTERDQQTGESRDVTYRDVIRTALNTPLKIDERENGKIASKQSFDRFMILMRVQDCIDAGTDMPGNLSSEDVTTINERVALLGMGAIVVGRLIFALDPVKAQQELGKVKAAATVEKTN